MEEITLSNEVVVSDPCYSIPTWCQKVLRNVLSGEYIVEVVKEDWGVWGDRCTEIILNHKDYIDKKKRWVLESDIIGVDSGQCGIFSKETYRNDNYKIPQGQGDVSFFGEPDGEGDDWYQKICSHTLGERQYGLYDKGVVSSSGIGDGVYNLYVKKDKKKIVGFRLKFS